MAGGSGVAGEVTQVNPEKKEFCGFWIGSQGGGWGGRVAGGGSSREGLEAKSDTKKDFCEFWIRPGRRLVGGRKGGQRLHSDLYSRDSLRGPLSELQKVLRKQASSFQTRPEAEEC